MNRTRTASVGFSALVSAMLIMAAAAYACSVPGDPTHNLTITPNVGVAGVSDVAIAAEGWCNSGDNGCGSADEPVPAALTPPLPFNLAAPLIRSASACTPIQDCVDPVAHDHTASACGTSPVALTDTVATNHGVMVKGPVQGLRSFTATATMPVKTLPGGVYTVCLKHQDTTYGAYTDDVLFNFFVVLSAG